MPQVIDFSSLLSCLTRERLVELGRALGLTLPSTARKERQVEVFVEAAPAQLGRVVGFLQRDELKAVCRQHGLPDHGRARSELARRVLLAAGLGDAAPAPAFAAEGEYRDVPQPGDVVRLRHRQYLVESVTPPSRPRRPGGPMTAHRVRLVGLDDDSQGRPLEVFWEAELGAQIRHSHTQALAAPAALDAPDTFGAYLATLRWHGVTATDARLFQAPFRAGIQLLNHQLVPLERALELPRANLFIADDVGLGKTIEAGLVLQELRLRQRVDFVLVVCPAAICRQWRDELWRRFGLYFEIVSRDFIARRRQERGFGVNAWGTHTRFIISHQLLRRPEYRDPLLQHLGERARKSLLILDEAHVAAPASASRYAVDSRITEVLRDVAPRFENRLFLSATPHNGHSNSFSALLELLDPQRFHRGVPVRPAQRDRVMVRRLKSDLIALGSGDFPRRHVVRVDLHQEGETWFAEAFDPLAASERHPLGPAEPFEIELAKKLAQYTKLVQPTRKRGRIALIRLQQRLLSSVEAFYRTLRRYAQSAAAGEPFGEPVQDELFDGPPDFSDDDDPDDDEIEARAEAEMALVARAAPPQSAEARRLLEQMLALAESRRDQPDAKTRALLDFLRRHCCPALAFGGAVGPKSDRQWSGLRLIVFTEFGHTLGYLERLLGAACEGTHLGNERIRTFRGGMDDARREEIQRLWNAPPDESPVRILLATDAAREGVNLQGACHHLFHFDVPWNPARLEQRNGRIDRTLQPAPEVYCHYFTYRDRPEDRVLDTLVRKVEVIQKEVGSLGTVILDEIEKLLATGIGQAEQMAEKIERAGELSELPRPEGPRPEGASRIEPRVKTLGSSIPEESEVKPQDSATGATVLEDPRPKGPVKTADSAVAEDPGFSPWAQFLTPLQGAAFQASSVLNRGAIVKGELERLGDDGRRHLKALEKEIDAAGKILNRSREAVGLSPELLRQTLDVALGLLGAPPLRPLPDGTFVLPALAESWQETLDTLRPHRGAEESFWDWRRRPPLPVAFEPAKTLREDRVHLHLEHPVVKRLLARFLAQGFSADDLSRVTALRDEGDARVHAVLFGRLSLFGQGATRLHDELLSVAAPWVDGEPGEPLAEADEARLVERLWRLFAAPTGPGAPLAELPAKVQERLAASVPAVFTRLWPLLRDEADHLAHRAEQKLESRGRGEAADLRSLLEEQRQALQEASTRQLTFDFGDNEKEQRRQWENDRRAIEQRLASIDREIDHEPRELEALFRVALRRLEPVGLVFLWPSTR